MRLNVSKFSNLPEPAALRSGESVVGSSALTFAEALG
jgi:hypothetical protein